MPSLPEDHDSYGGVLEGEPLRPLPPLGGGMAHFPTEDDDGPGPEPVLYRPWVVASIAVVSLLMLIGALLLRGIH